MLENKMQTFVMLTTIVKFQTSRIFDIFKLLYVKHAADNLVLK